jgi:hypothetical protein
MDRSLFIGDSHAHGYVDDPEKGLLTWQDNNYAEIYSKINSKPVAVYAQPGACNKKYPVWLKSMFEHYKDIDEVFIQSTYWNRYLLACSRNLDIGDGIKANHFRDDPVISNHIERWTDVRTTENYVELVEQQRRETFEEFKGFTYDEKNITADWGPFHEKFTYTKLWHESITHLQYREYCGDLYIIDNLCQDYGVKWYLWNINDRVYMPENYEFYGPLKQCTRTDISAQEFIQQNFNYNIDDYTSDGEHYFYDTHEIIAKDYIPYIKNLTKT